ncbi:MAG: aminotransferase class I/II-fold pyridoxal phosphate-dependent enzyme [Gemmatimonadales bacterium]|nr:MAG: aminotransferase class I/II-fold pyridoxal phosphate-dependent enzyme [Gemmatimonadales bacterium]
MDHRSLESLSTRVIHGGTSPLVEGAPVVPPPVQSATFVGGGPDGDPELLYTRYGNNPTQMALGARIASLEGMEAGVGLGSGMAAISLSILSLVEAGDHIVSSRFLYGATLAFMEHELPRRGVSVSWVDPWEEGSWQAALQERTRLLYLESPVNPTLRIVDLRPVVEVARGRGIPVVMDATFASPVNLRPGAWGVDLVIHSATKYLGGHSDLIAGVVAGSQERILAVTRLLHLYGPALDPHTAWLLDRGIRTLDVRMERHNRNALELARWFQGQEEVAHVVHPGLPSHPDHALATELMDGFGGMLAVELKGGAQAADAFCRALRLATVAPSLGGVETLVSLPRLTSHRGMSPDQRVGAGIPDGLVRISAGIEGLQDLTTDFSRALRAVTEANASA